MTAWRGKIKIALITGQHPFVVQDLQGFFRSIDEVDCYPQHMEDFVNDIGSARHINRWRPTGAIPTLSTPDHVMPSTPNTLCNHTKQPPTMLGGGFGVVDSGWWIVDGG